MNPLSSNSFALGRRDFLYGLGASLGSVALTAFLRGEENSQRTSRSHFPAKAHLRQPYDFIEIMPAYENYVPDLQPADTDARTRGLAQVCLVIFNLNEFVYLD